MDSLRAWALILLLPWFLALDWADDIFNTLGVPNVPGIGFVKNAIRFVGNMILGLIHLAISVLKPIVADAWGTIAHAADLAAHGLYNLAGRVETGLNDLIHTAYGWLLTALHYADTIVGRAIHDITQWATDGLHFLGGLLDALNRDVIQPLWHFAHDAWNYLTSVIIPSIVNEAKRLEHDFFAGLDRVIGDVNGILNTISRTVLKWAPVIEKAFGWLVWLALHPFDVVNGIWDTFVHFDPQGFLGALTSAFDSSGQALEDWIVKWLGG